MIKEKVLNGVKRGVAFSRIERVLVIRLDEIGDVILTVPFLRELRINLPDAWITLVVKPAVYNIVELCPYVDEVLTYNWSIKGWYSKVPIVRSFVKSLFCKVRAFSLCMKHLWRRRFDMALIPRWDVDYYGATFLAFLSGARYSIGYSEKNTFNKMRENKNYDVLLTHPVKRQSVKHEVCRSIDMLTEMGFVVDNLDIELWISDDDVSVADALLGDVADGDTQLIAVSPGAGAKKRCWPISRFVELIRWICTSFYAKVILIGGPEDRDLGDYVSDALGNRVINIIGKTTLRQTVALLKRCSLFVGSDSGPMHMAAACNVPVVEISCHPKNGYSWSSNSPTRFGPWRVPHIVVQPDAPVSPCYGECRAGYPHCILGVSIDEVKRAVERLFAVGGRAEVICKIRSKC